MNKKTQTITPTLMGEMIYDVVSDSIRPLLNPALTASWEKGLTGVAEGTITSGEYMDKLDDFVRRRTNIVKQLHNQSILYQQFDAIAGFYQKKETAPAVKKQEQQKKDRKERKCGRLGLFCKTFAALKRQKQEEKKMEAMKIRNLYNLEETIAAPLLEQYEYPWEVLPYIKEFIKALGNVLPEDRFEKEERISGWQKARLLRRLPA